MSLHEQPGTRACDVLERRSSADLACDGCGAPLCFDHAYRLPAGQHACIDCWCDIQIVWPFPSPEQRGGGEAR